MLDLFTRGIFPGRRPSLEKRYQTEYGPFLKRNPVQTSEKFYSLLITLASRYLTTDSLVLDAGCGLGRFAIDAGNKKVKKVIGIENKDDLVYEASAIAGGHRDHILSYPCRGNYSFMHGDVLNLSFKNGSFSFVSCINVIDRVFDPQQCVKELYRVLANGGILFLVDPYDWSNSYTPALRQVSNMKTLFKNLPISLLYEKDSIPFNIYINPRCTLAYKSHALILRKTK